MSNSKRKKRNSLIEVRHTDLIEPLGTNIINFVLFPVEELQQQLKDKVSQCLHLFVIIILCKLIYCCIQNCCICFYRCIPRNTRNLLMLMHINKLDIQMNSSVQVTMIVYIPVILHFLQQTQFIRNFAQENLYYYIIFVVYIPARLVICSCSCIVCG